ncbi:T-protein [bacterium BMS3Abin15]|nr:T-protein [bacterium BMS3Abin15]HDZ85656.1 chorismate mutase [Candidatus Moranbacteria bacterium]
MSNELKNLRKGIDKADKEIVKNLAKRFSLTEKVGQYKKRNNLKPFDKKREEEIFKKKITLANKYNLDKDLIKKIFFLIMKAVKRRHKKISKK